MSPINAAVIGPSDVRWRSVLEEMPHDFYHLPEYLKVAARFENGIARAFIARSDDGMVFLPGVLRPVPEGLGETEKVLDASSPYGYASPLFLDGVPPTSTRSLIQALCAEAASASIVTAFCRMHPLLPAPIAIMQEFGQVVQHGETVWIDLSPPLAELHGSIRAGHRYDIRKLAASGFEVRIDDWTYFRAFVQIYLDTMRRVSASEYYLFSEDYFDGLRSLGCVTLCVVLAPDGSVAAGGLFSQHRGIVQYLFSGTADAYAKQGPSKLMISEVMAWARAQGNRAFHLGGGVGAGQDSLFKFKAGFSGLRAPFHTWRLILDESRYSALVARRGAGAPVDGGYFPAYRAPRSA